ncbi:DUF6889 family protein [Clostridium butyricum]|uniref:DUF6889 family protein n=1 Tax=Clostridium butyricum TaxID=1492 RepID=UPI0038CD1E6D
MLPAKFKNINAFLFAPVEAGHWNQHELWDGTYDLDDLLDIHEMMSVSNENKMRSYDAAKKEV